jgi:hypothetical protein
MTTDQRLENLEKKLDRLLFIMGEGREKSDAQLEREADSIMEKIRLRDERKERKNAKTS